MGFSVYRTGPCCVNRVRTAPKCARDNPRDLISTNTRTSFTWDKQYSRRWFRLEAFICNRSSTRDDTRPAIVAQRFRTACVYRPTAKYKRL